MSSVPIVLLVDHLHEDLVLAKYALEKCVVPHRLVVARSTAEVLIVLRDLCQAGSQPGLILVELELQPDSALALVQAVRTMPGLNGTPLVALTSLPEPARLTAAYRAGFVSVVDKPLGQKERERVLNLAVSYWLTAHRKP